MVPQRAADSRGYESAAALDGAGREYGCGGAELMLLILQALPASCGNSCADFSAPNPGITPCQSAATCDEFLKNKPLQCKGLSELAPKDLNLD